MASSAAGDRALRLVSAPLEVLGVSASNKSSSLRRNQDNDGDAVAGGSTDGALLHVVQANHPHIESTQQAASTSSCLTASALVTATVTPYNAGLIEIRTFLRGSSRANAAPQQILLPAPLLDGIHIHAHPTSDETIVLCACTVTGWAYRIQLPLHLLSSVDDIPARWTSVHRIAAVSSTDAVALAKKSVLRQCHCSEDGQAMLVACSDGRVVKLFWSGEEDGHSTESRPSQALEGQWTESILQAQTFLSRFFGRSNSNALPTQIASMTTYARSSHPAETLAFIVTQDRKLRLWDLGNDTCIRVVDLPSTASKSGSSSQGVDAPDASARDSDEVQRNSSTSLMKHCKIATYSLGAQDGSGAHALYVVVYLPASGQAQDFLACYGVQVASISSSSSRQFAGSVGDVDLVWQQSCGKEVSRLDSELRDLVVVHDVSSAHVWCLWDASGNTQVRCLDVTSHASRRWRTVHLACSYSPVQGVALDDEMAALEAADEIPAFMMARLMEPTRFSRKSFEYAFDAYEDSLVERGHAYEHLLPASFEQTSLEEQIEIIVGITLDLQLDPTSGAPRHDEYFAAMKREWSTFVGLLFEHDLQERWAIGLAATSQQGSSGAPLVISSGFVSLPVDEDAVSSLWRRSRGNEADASASAVAVLRLARDLEQEVHPSAWATFQDELLKSLKAQASIPVEMQALLIWDSHIASNLDLEAVSELNGRIPVDGMINIMEELLDLLHGSDSIRRPSRQVAEFEAALVSDALCQLVADRFNIARLLSRLALAIRVGIFEGSEAHDDRIDAIIYSSVVAMHRYLAYCGAARTSAAYAIHLEDPLLADDDSNTRNVEMQMKGLQFEAGAETTEESGRTVASNLIHLGIIRGYLGGVSHSSSKTIAANIEAMSDELINLLAPRPLDSGVEIGAVATQFAQKTLQMGLPAESLAFIGFFPSSVATSFIVARASILVGDHDAAADAFRNVASVIGAYSKGTDEHDYDAQILQQSIASAVPANASKDDIVFQIYRYVVASFQQAKSARHVAEFSQRAISLLQGRTDVPSSVVRALHTSLFQSNLTLWRFDEAYMQLVVMPFDDMQRESLRSLISIMCEKGFVEELLAFNFAGIQGEVERTLSFKARNSDPLAEGLNYYDVLYAFHLRRGDLKSAGATMWQMGKRINDLGRRLAVPGRAYRGETGAQGSTLEAKRQFIILEAQCFLKSINVLSLITPADAWFAYEMSSADDDAELVESSKLTAYVPKTSFHKEAHEIRIVYLADIRRHYQILVAYLELAALYPEDAIPTPRGTSGTVTTFTMLFVQSQDFERAFNFAHSVNADREQIFSALTEKCLELSKWSHVRKQSAKTEGGSSRDVVEHPYLRALLDDDEVGVHEDFDDAQNRSNRPIARFLERADRTVGWTGPIEKRAWRYLRFWLTMESGQEAARYRSAVFEYILARRQKDFAPKWMLQWLRQHRADVLIKSLCEHEYYADALEEAIGAVEQTTERVTQAARPPRIDRLAVHAYKTWLPYLVIDELLQRAEDTAKSGQQGSDGSASDYTRRRDLCSKLRQAIDQHKTTLARIESEERRTLLEREAREQRLDAQDAAQRSERQRPSDDVAMAE